MSEGVLGKEIGKGGEGTVYERMDHPQYVVKVFNVIPDEAKCEKIQSMLKQGSESLRALSTWPLELFFQEGKLRGFVMERLTDHRPLYDLYNPKLRLQYFPQADFSFLIHVAMNLARAFRVVHGAGHTVGDVNHGNVWVSKEGVVRLIDTDSFQIQDGGRLWSCDVGVAAYQPPEMQHHTSFKGIVRTTDHDYFGLAVLIFQLLFMGRHPFAGCFSGGGDMPVERAISEYCFAYSENGAKKGIVPPPASLPIDFLTVQVRRQFERAFTQGSQRPIPEDWISSLEELQETLFPCVWNPTHLLPAHLTTCPWCHMESRIGRALFPFAPVTDPFDPVKIWSEIEAIKLSPQESYKTPLQPLMPSQSARELTRKLFWTRLGLGLTFTPLLVLAPILPQGIILGVSLLALTTLIYVYRRLRRKWLCPFRAKLKTLEDELHHLTHDSKMTELTQKFSHTIQALIRLKQEVDQLTVKITAFKKKSPPTDEKELQALACQLHQQKRGLLSGKMALLTMRDHIEACAEKLATKVSERMSEYSQARGDVNELENHL